MSTFLQLAVRLRQECGVAGTGPTAVTNQTGEAKRLVDWASQSYVDIQNKHRGNWRWLRSEFSLSTSSGDDEYAYGDATDTIASATISRFARWHLDGTTKIYLTSAGVGTQNFLTPINWPAFQTMFKIGSQTSSYPGFVAADPRRKLRLGPKPDAAYTVTGDYQKSAQILAADADEPEMPSDFHMLIVYEAMKKYAAFHGAPEVWTAAREEYFRMMRDLEVDQLPVPSFGNPLV